MTLPIANQNWLTASPSIIGVNALTSAEYPLISTWSNATAYAAGAIVTGPDGRQYQALVANTAVTPPAPGTWTPSAYTSPDQGLIAQSAIPLPTIPQWDARTTYPPGAMVTYGAHQFVTPAGCVGITPPSVPDNNIGWEYVSASQNAYTASFYYPDASPYPASLLAGIEWYDAAGHLIAAPSLMGPSGASIALPFYQRLTTTTAEMNATSGNTLNLTWTANPTGFWQISAGMLFPNPTWSGSQHIKLLYVTDTRSDCCVGATCQTGVVNSATADVGVLFRMSDVNNLWLLCRQKLQKLVAGTLTTVASWTRLPIGSRMFVQLSGSTIKVYTYPGSPGAPTLVTTVTDSFNSTATHHGLYYQVY